MKNKLVKEIWELEDHREGSTIHSFQNTRRSSLTCCIIAPTVDEAYDTLSYVTGLSDINTKEQNKWELTTKVKEKYNPIVTEFIAKIESEEFNEDEDCTLDLSNTELNPYTLQELLEGMEYEEKDRDYNGWELDYWIYMEKSRFKNLCIHGTAITFELKLSVKEYM